jgi:hypothetical protein
MGSTTNCFSANRLIDFPLHDARRVLLRIIYRVRVAENGLKSSTVACGLLCMQRVLILLASGGRISHLVCFPGSHFPRLRQKVITVLQEPDVALQGSRTLCLKLPPRVRHILEPINGSPQQNKTSRR